MIPTRTDLKIKFDDLDFRLEGFPGELAYIYKRVRRAFPGLRMGCGPDDDSGFLWHMLFDNAQTRHAPIRIGWNIEEPYFTAWYTLDPADDPGITLDCPASVAEFVIDHFEEDQHAPEQ